VEIGTSNTNTGGIYSFEINYFSFTKLRGHRGLLENEKPHKKS